MATAGKESFPFNNDQEFELQLGNSFNTRPGPKNAFHTIRYDFKPASVDTSRPAELVVGAKNDITVTVPHIQDSGTTVYKGSKRACPKEFLLVVDKDTKTFTLERISSTVPQLKKIRSSSKTPKTVPAIQKKQQTASSTTTSPSPVPTVTAPSSSSQETSSPKGTSTGALSADSNSESSQSDSSSDSENEQKDDDDDDDEVAAEDVQQLDNILSASMNQSNQSSSNGPEFTHLLNDDLQLSESGSDSD